MCSVLLGIYVFKYFENHHVTTSRYETLYVIGTPVFIGQLESTLGLYMLSFTSGEVIHNAFLQDDLC